VRVAYLINQYPAVSHTFIRREIHALERLGVSVDRIALRGWNIPLVDSVDLAERVLTRYVLKGGVVPLLGAALSTAVSKPMAFLRALKLAWGMSRQSEKRFPVHVAYLLEACVIKKWMQQSGATHLHAHFATNPAEVAMLVRALGGAPYSFTAHGSDIMDRPAQVGLAETVGRSVFAVAVCSYGRSQICRWIPQALWPRVQVVRCGLEAGYGAQSTTSSTDAVRFVCVGRLSKEKGQLLLIEAMAKAVRLSSKPFDLVLVGDGPQRLDVQALVQRLGVADRVRITGWLDAQGVRAEMSAATALVVPSLSEGLPVAIMEAMASRRPVIAPYLAGIPELVCAGDTGWLFPASDVDALADAMLACVEAPANTLAAMGDSAFERVWRMHHVDVEAGKLKTLMAG
jgi:colanic acid/amylovoran biosynthesis glycosyltransferase